MNSISAIVGLLSSPDEGTQQHAASALAALAEEESARETLYRLGTLSHIIRSLAAANSRAKVRRPPSYSTPSHCHLCGPMCTALSPRTPSPRSPRTFPLVPPYPSPHHMLILRERSTPADSPNPPPEQDAPGPDAPAAALARVSMVRVVAAFAADRRYCDMLRITIQPLVAMLGGQKGVIAVVPHAARALTSLSHSEPNRDALREAGAQRKMAELLLHPESRVQASAVQCVANLGVDVTDAKAFMDAGWHLALIQLLSAPAVEVQGAAAAVLGNLSAVSEFREALLANGALQPILELLQATELPARTAAVSWKGGGLGWGRGGGAGYGDDRGLRPTPMRLRSAWPGAAGFARACCRASPPFKRSSRPAATARARLLTPPPSPPRPASCPPLRAPPRHHLSAPSYQHPHLPDSNRAFLPSLCRSARWPSCPSSSSRSFPPPTPMLTASCPAALFRTSPLPLFPPFPADPGPRYHVAAAHIPGANPPSLPPY